MRRHVIGAVGAVAAVVLLCACSTPVATPPASPATSPAAPTPAGVPAIISGIVTAGPVCPVEQNPPDPACAPRPVAGAVIVATDAGGVELCRATTQADGTFELIIPQTGMVSVTGEPVPGLMGVPTPVTVELAEPGQVVRLDLAYDTGIR